MSRPTRSPGCRVRSLMVAWALLFVASKTAAADSLDALPPPWDQRLVRISKPDISGAERLVQEAIHDTWHDLETRLRDPNASQDGLAEVYGRLGALFLLVEVETVADACLRNAERLQPSAFRWPYYAGYLAMLAGRPEQAIEDLQRARGLDPGYAPLNLRLGKVMLDTGRLEEAQVLLEAIADQPGLEAAVAFHLGQIASLQRRYVQAVDWFERSLSVDPAPSGVRYQLAQAYRALGDDEQARRHLGGAGIDTGSPAASDPLIAALEAVTRRAQPFFERALYAIGMARYGLAVQAFAEGLAIDPDNLAARVSYARALYLNGDRAEAEQALAGVLSAAPQQPLAHFLLGILSEADGDERAAAEAYRRVLAIEPTHAGAAFYLANLDLRAGRFDEAAAGYARVLSLSDAVGPAALLELVAASRGGEPESWVLVRLRERMLEWPDEEGLRYALALGLAAARDPSNRDPEQSLKLARELVMARPLAPYRRVLALALMAGGRSDEAITTLEALIADAIWSAPPGEFDSMMTDIERFRAGEIVPEPWPIEDPFLNPPPFDPLRVFRDYPAAVPY